MDEQPLNPKEQARAQRLFEQLAAEEPPLDPAHDTAPAKTAPRPAVAAEDTRPVRAVGGMARYAFTLLLALALVVTLVATVAVFMQTGQEDSDPAPVVIVGPASATPAGPAAATSSPVPTLEVPPSPSPSPSQAPAEVANPPVQVAAVVNFPPTALPEERGLWLLTPAAPVTLRGSNGLIRQDEAFTVAGAATRLEVAAYTVQSGDTLLGVADKFDLDVCSVVWANPRNKVSPLRPGVIIDIPPIDGALFKLERPMSLQEVADSTQVSVQALIDSPYNDLRQARADTVLPEGLKVMAPNGSGGNCNIWEAKPSASSSGGVAGGGGGGGSLWGCAYGVEAGGFTGVTPVAGNYTFFQGFSLAHTGVDLAASTGTPVVSAGSGAVAFAGWNEYGYGNAIVIDHGGIFTLYAHLSAINVSCGQQVGSGDVIGAVGSTGRSSGPHLHFEIRDAGFNPVDPTYSIRL